MVDISKRAKFDFIRYANVWEDADILLEALIIKPNDKCVSIASAGDNTLAMLLNSPSKVIAIDLNPAQLACLDLRIAAFRCLSYEESLGFLGIKKEKKRLEIYNDIKSKLSKTSKKFWDANPDLIKKGIIFVGKFENYFRIYRNLILPLSHRKKIINKLIAKKSIKEQLTFYEKYWDNFIYRNIFRIFFSKTVMGFLGRDPEFFRFVKGTMADHVKARAKHGFTKIPTFTNPYLNFIITRNFPQHALPSYLRKENYALIKQNLDCIELFHGDLMQCLDYYDADKFDAFNLSDIFEYMNEAEFENNLNRLVKSSSSGARIAYWNMMVDRILPKNSPFKIDKKLSDSLFYKDKAFFYKRFIVGEVFNSQ